MKKIVTVLVAISLLISLNASVNAAPDFASNEAHYMNKCASADLSKADVDVCNEFNQYLNNKEKQLQQQIKDNDTKLDSIKDDIVKIAAELREIQAKKVEKEKEITFINTRISNLEASILKKNTQIKERMYIMQSYTNSNGFIEFIIGAKDFSDLFSRLESVQDITAYDRELIRKLLVQKEELSVEKEKALEAKKTIESLEATATAAQSLALQKEAEYMEIAEKKAQETEEMKKARSEVQKAIAAALASNDGSGLNPSATPGWNKLVDPGSKFVSATPWAYPTGGYHMGLDIAGPVGSKVYAPANGVLIYQSFTCPTYGSGLLDSCGGYKGNYVLLAVNVNGKTYGVLLQHLEKTPILWPTSTNPFISVPEGAYVGRLGNSGSSTGPHLHVEVFDLSHLSISGAIQLFSQTGLDFGIGFGAAGYGTRCDVKAPPCRVNVANLYNYSYGLRF